MEKQILRIMIRWGVLLGLWLIIAPFVLGYTQPPAASWNSIVVGVVVAVTALARSTGRSHKQTGCNWLNALAGIWLIVSPFALGFFSHSWARWNGIIVGIIMELSLLIFLRHRSAR